MLGIEWINIHIFRIWPSLKLLGEWITCWDGCRWFGNCNVHDPGLGLGSQSVQNTRGDVDNQAVVCFNLRRSNNCDELVRCGDGTIFCL